jgi:hypothetical protein
MSASKMRKHAITRNYNEFKKGIPSTVHPEHAKELYNDVRKHMDIPIGSDTSSTALTKHAKRDDEIGVKARKEVERRAQEKTVLKTKIKQPKSIKENMISFIAFSE